MKDRPERQHLEEALKDEPVGSPKIQALGDYAMLKDIEWRTEHRPAEMDEFDSLQLIMEKAALEQYRRMRRLYANFSKYKEAFENAEAIVDPYLATDSTYTSPYQISLPDTFSNV